MARRHLAHHLPEKGIASTTLARDLGVTENRVVHDAAFAIRHSHQVVQCSSERGYSYLNKCESGKRAVYVAELWAIGKIYGKPISFFAPDEP
jgi:hypothetical protein